MALAFFVGVVLVFRVQIDRSGTSLIYYGGFNMSGLPTWMLQAVALIGLVFMLGRESLVPEWNWSPYYKIQAVHPVYDPTITQIFVNGPPHQSMATVATRRANDPVYFVPYQRAKGGTLDNVLIVGVGTGTDVAIALAEGARHVDAMEIDPRLYQIGELSHPDHHPYQDPRVSVTINDGRAFLADHRGGYHLSRVKKSGQFRARIGWARE